MPLVRPALSDVQRTFAALVRHDVNAAAGADAVVDGTEAASLRPFLQASAASLGAGDHPAGDVVDAAMARATAGWASVNQSSGPGASRLSQAEIAALRRTDPDLAAWTTTASHIALRNANPLTVSLDGAPAGVALEKSGSHYTVSADATVPVGASFHLVVDDHALALSRGPAGIDTTALTAPAGYGVDVTHKSVMTDPVQTATLAITKDDPSWLKPAQLARKATSGLLHYVKHTRIHDGDWGDVFPKTWSENVARGVPAQIAAFVDNADTQVLRTRDAVTYVGRGPYDLYTEITVAKKDGAVTHVLVEID